MKSIQWLRGIALAMALGWLPCAALAAQPDPVRFALAVEQRQLETVKEWLAEGLDADFQADRVGSGLMIAAWGGDIAMMELFLKYGAQVNLRNRYDEQALQLAAWKGHLEAVEWLLAHGADIDRPGRWNALHYAAFADQKEIVGLLIEHGAQVNARAPNGSTALMMTAREGREELARQLLAAGADPRATNESGESALTWAMRHEHFRIAQLVSSAAEFAKAAQAAPESFGPRVRSVQAPSEIEEILRQIRLAQAAGKPVEALRKALFAAVERFKQDSRKLVIGKARPGEAVKRGKPQALIITAKRGPTQGSGSERAELLYPKSGAETASASNDVTEILERIARARAAGKPVGDLRNALLDAVERFKKEPAP
ncbi:MAG: ankyrin repeat domain-containing protein [Proteobacteria bacterium]|nr:ankyrin repeat domain-containing protein [Pseudomonadota bacterium]